MCLRKVLHDYYQGHTLRGQGQGQVTKRHLKKGISMPHARHVFLGVLYIDIENNAHLSL